MAEKFKPYDIVYHKANFQRGMILGGFSQPNKWVVEWQKDACTVLDEAQLYTEEEAWNAMVKDHRKRHGDFIG